MNQTAEPLISPPPINYIHTLHEAVKYRQEEISYSYLMGISGEAFRFFYSRLEPEAGMNVFFHNPLRAACKALGFRHEVLYDETYQDAYDRLQENIRAGKPALLPFSDSCPFLMEGNHPETLICQNGSRYKLEPKEIREKWQPGGGFLELGPHGYYQFVIEDREREPKGREVALGAFRGASKLMRTRRRIRNCAVGLAAYDELLAHLNSLIDRKRKKELTEREIHKIATWNGQPLLQCIEARNAAVAYLQSVREHFEDEELKHLNKAIVTYQNVVKLLRKLRLVLPSMSLLSGWSAKEIPGDRGGVGDFSDKPSKLRFNLSSSLILASKLDMIDNIETTQERAVKRFKMDCRAAIKLLKKVFKAETTGIGELEDVVKISEKLKM